MSLAREAVCRRPSSGREAGVVTTEMTDPRLESLARPGYVRSCRPRLTRSSETVLRVRAPHRAILSRRLT